MKAKKILVVDDDPLVLITLAEGLRDAGIEPAGAVLTQIDLRKLDIDWTVQNTNSSPPPPGGGDPVVTRAALSLPNRSQSSPARRY